MTHRSALQRASASQPGRSARNGGEGQRWPASVLLAYPPSWRARYGDELDALVSDLGGGGRRAIPMALDLLRGAAAAWLHLKRGPAMSEQSRSALYTVLWSWVAFAATAAWFGHDLGQYPNPVQAVRLYPAHPGVPDAYHVLLGAGIVGVAATAVAALAFAVSAVRYARASNQRSLYSLMAVPPVVAAIWLGGLHLITRSGTIGGDGIAVLWLLLGVAGIAVSTQAVIKVVGTCEPDARTWRVGSVAATVVTAAMLVATGATITWGLIVHASQPRLGDQGEWLTVTVIMAVTTARAVIALIRARRSGLAPAEQPAVA
jgi:hypothetical protein